MAIPSENPSPTKVTQVMDFGYISKRCLHVRYKATFVAEMLPRASAAAFTTWVIRGLDEKKFGRVLLRHRSA